ncbi:hypothetical protein GX586_04395 [bacterium]|nr:hypothetical protein [bacterium]
MNDRINAVTARLIHALRATARGVLCLVLTVSLAASGEEPVGSQVRERTQALNATIVDSSATEAAAPGDNGSGSAEPPPPPSAIAGQARQEQFSSTAELISLNYKNGDLRNILRLIARVSDINLIAGPEVQGTVTIEIKNEPWERVLALVLSINGYTYVREGNIIRVVSTDRVDKEPLAVSIIPVNYAKASELLVVVRPLLTPERGKVESDARANVIIATDIPAKLAQIEKVIQRLDQPTPQVLIESKFVEINLSDVDSEGVDWTSMGSYGVTLHDMLYTFDRQLTETKTRTDERGTLQNIAQRGYDMIRNDNSSTTYQFEPDDFRLAFSLLMNDGRAKLISNPKLQTLDNKLATIRVAETHYKPTFTYNNEVGAYEINSLEEIYVGITLEVTPHINYDGYITLDIIPEVSALTGNQIIQGVEVPITNVRRIQTRVTLRDRNTVAIGGMVRDDLTDTSRSVPYLADIPYLGEACFTWSTKEKRTVNLVIFITPTVIKPDSPHDRWDRQLRDMQLTHAGDWQEVVSNYPSWHMISLREQLLLKGMTNDLEAVHDATLRYREPAQ